MKSIFAAALAVLLVAGPAAAGGFGHLEGIWSPRGATLLNKHGYQTVWSINATTYWWNGAKRKCVEVVEGNDHFVSLERVPHEVCTTPGRWMTKV
jgi:hypothetical protein